MEPYELLKTGLCAFMGEEFGDETISRFRVLTERMVSYNEKVNLTRITEPDEVVKLHYLDSAAIFAHVRIKEGARVADIGTGAGFPGLVLKLLRPDIKLCLIDSSNKRIEYLRGTAQLLELSDISFVHGRAEELAREKEYRERFDLVVSRAVAQLPKLCELCAPFARPGGEFIAYKGSDAQAEADIAENAAKMLGCGAMRVLKAEIPECNVDHSLVVMKKERKTPMAYPRKNALIQNSPL